MKISRILLLALVAAVSLVTYLALGDGFDHSHNSPPDRNEDVQTLQPREPPLSSVQLAKPAEHGRAAVEAAQIDRQVESLMASSEAPENLSELEADTLELSRLHVQESSLLKEEILKAMRSPDRLIPSEDFNERPQSNEAVVYVSVRQAGAAYYSPVMRGHAPELFEVRDRIRELELKPANRERLELTRILKEDALLNSVRDK